MQRLDAILRFLALVVLTPLAGSVATILYGMQFPYNLLVTDVAWCLVLYIIIALEEEAENTSVLLYTIVVTTSLFFVWSDIASGNGRLISGEMIALGGSVWTLFGLVHFLGVASGRIRSGYV